MILLLFVSFRVFRGLHFARLEILADPRKLRAVNRTAILPIALMVIFALSRIPGMFPQNFSAVYALMFCAGVYFTGRLAWWIPFVVMLITDIGLNLYYWLALGYDVWGTNKLGYLALNYVGYAALFFLGRKFKPGSSFVGLLGGGILGALLFYLITNTASWLLNPFNNPEYTKTLAGWFVALTKGTAGWPQTWEFFRNTLLSGGLFTGLFVAAMKLTTTAESAAEKEEAPEAEPDEPQPEESKA